jgi:hypothetical protein
LYPEVFQSNGTEDATNIKNNFGKRWGWYHHIRVLMASFNFTMQQAEEMRVHEAFLDMSYHNDLHQVSKQKQ